MPHSTRAPMNDTLVFVLAFIVIVSIPFGLYAAAFFVDELPKMLGLG